jgi:hypothetical protein
MKYYTAHSLGNVEERLSSAIGAAIYLVSNSLCAVEYMPLITEIYVIGNTLFVKTEDDLFSVCTQKLTPDEETDALR